MEYPGTIPRITAQKRNNDAPTPPSLPPRTSRLTELITSNNSSHYSHCSASALTQFNQARCICCKSLLRYDLNVTSFRCTVCDTINDTVPLEISEEVKTSFPLSESRLSRLRASETAVLQLIDFSFRNWSILNSSFLNSEPISLQECGVDMKQVANTYELLLNMENPDSVLRTLMNAIDGLLRRIGRPLNSKDQIQFLLILLEFPPMIKKINNSYSQLFQSILGRLFGILSNLGNDLHHYLVHWFSKMEACDFRKRVEIINLFITQRLTMSINRNPSQNYQSYANDWCVSAAARVMALLFAANNIQKKIDVSDFYNTMVDFIDLPADYDSWQAMHEDFCFCQYPFLLSMGAKLRILELDAKRQMDRKMKEAMTAFIWQKRVVMPYLIIKVRRSLLLEDSLDQLSSQHQDLKKKLRIEFVGEPGIDAGGLTKEWFLLLVRELFSLNYGMFTFEEESNYFWFNPASFEASDQFYLVGVIIGLAIYNSTILDIQLPTACYKKLLGAPVGIEDLAQFRPELCKGFEKLLAYEGDIENVFCLEFAAQYELYGQVQQVPLTENGEKISVNNENRQEYVDKYTDFILNKSIERQFEPFKRGFYNVCGGNALSLFRPEEVELVVRGSAEPLQLQELQAATLYEGFHPEEPVIKWFWDIWMESDVETQRKILMFITGSDRVPAVGTATMKFKITYAGEDCERYIGGSAKIIGARFPQAHTCFNQLMLYRYRGGKNRIRDKLLRAVYESEGFGLK